MLAHMRHMVGGSRCAGARCAASLASKQKRQDPARALRRRGPPRTDGGRGRPCLYTVTSKSPELSSRDAQHGEAPRLTRGCGGPLQTQTRLDTATEGVLLATCWHFAFQPSAQRCMRRSMHAEIGNLSPKQTRKS